MNVPSSFAPETGSLLHEIFQEASSTCSGSDCQCQHCQGNRVRNSNNLSKEINLNEELELSDALDKIKSLAKRGYNKAKPWIIAARIIIKLTSGAPEPEKALKDVVVYLMQEKKRLEQQRIEAAQIPNSRRFGDKPPNKEMALLQEIFMEAEYELQKNELNMEEDDFNEHTKNARPSTKEKHQYGVARKKRDWRGEKGDSRRRWPRNKPKNWKGAWPPVTNRP